MAEQKTRQFSFYMTPDDERRLDELRKRQHDYPSRNEMLRRLLRWAEVAPAVEIAGLVK